AKDLGLLAIPGVATATEVQAAFAAGYRLLKVFPAGTLGGPQLVSSLAEVYPEVQFMPSGGVNATTMRSYLSLGPCIAAVSGTWLTQAAGAAEAAPEVVRQRCDHARSIVEFEASCRW
ncbi:MAG: keto-deoxy-phosphogluconate aldolase, partial [Actinobacteria bacterium]|nr:keto-deoxy-phosphogluconate aldolase [Actinomycetota bacterium]